MEEILFGQGTGLNTDDDPRFMPPGDGDRRNVVPFEDGKYGLLTSLKGNEIISGQPYTGKGRVIGKVLDEQANGLIFFLKGYGEANVTDHPRWDENANHYGLDTFNFNGLPGGLRMPDGSYILAGGEVYFITSSLQMEDRPVFGRLRHDAGTLTTCILAGTEDKNVGSSIYLVRDATEVEQSYDDGRIIPNAYIGNDYDLYDAVKIGGQVWINKGLRETKFADDTVIPTGLSDVAWGSDTAGASAVYPHASLAGLGSDQEVIDAYGRLYNWYAVDKGLVNVYDGWRLPEGNDFSELRDYLTGYEDITTDNVGNHLKSLRQANSPLGNMPNSIVRRNIDTEDFDVVLEENLNFGNHIEARIVDRVLIWTDTKPYAVNIDEAIKYTANETSVYTQINDEVISFARYAPSHRPTVNYVSDALYEHNFLRGKQFQFIYKYEYYDYSQSVWSSISAVPVGDGDEDIYGDFLDDMFINNKIEVGVHEGSDIVKKIHVAVREGNTGLFRMATVLDKDEISFTDGWYDYEFTNDVKGDIIPDEEVFRLYDDVPIEADFVEVIKGNTVTFGQITKGYNPITPDVTLAYNIEQVTIPSETELGEVEKIYQDKPVGEETILFNLPDIDYNGVKVELGWVYTDSVPNYNTASHVFGEGYDREDVITYFDALPNIPFEAYVWNGINMLRFPSDDEEGALVQYREEDAAYIELSPESIETAEIAKLQSFKFGEQHNFALGYKDKEGRLMYLLRSEDMDVDLPFLRETQVAERVEINWSINHHAPLHAKYYQWFYLRNTPRFQQFILRQDDIKEKSSGIYININGSVNRIRGDGVMMPFYSFQKGDRIRIIGHGDYWNIARLTTLYDMEIKEESVEEDGTYIIVPENIYDFTVESRILIEIYSPIRTETNIYQEFSDIYEVEANHNEATGTFDGGDIYVRLLAPYFWGEDAHFSYYNDSDSINVGKAVFIPSIQRRIELQDVVHGRKYFEDTRINGLFSFYSSDTPASLSGTFGKIRGMALRGDTLRVYQERKNTSVYIGSVIVTRPDGSSELMASDRLLGTIVPAVNDYGTNHPKSIVRVGRTIYFFDEKNKAYLRDSVNGVFPISGVSHMPEQIVDYKMRTFFMDVTEAKSGYDPYYKLVIVQTNKGTLAFHEKSNRWISYYDMEMDDYLGTGKRCFAWKDGMMYEQNVKDTTEICGDEKDVVIEFVSGIRNQKSFISTIALHCNKPLRIDVEIPPDDSYRWGMESYLEPGWFKTKRGIYYAAFLRNILTSGEEKTSNLHNGEKLRGYFAKIKMTGDSPIELFKVDIGHK